MPNDDKGTSKVPPKWNDEYGPCNTSTQEDEELPLSLSLAVHNADTRDDVAPPDENVSLSYVKYAVSIVPMADKIPSCFRRLVFQHIDDPLSYEEFKLLLLLSGEIIPRSLESLGDIFVFVRGVSKWFWRCNGPIPPTPIRHGDDEDDNDDEDGVNA